MQQIVEYRERRLGARRDFTLLDDAVSVRGRTFFAFMVGLFGSHSRMARASVTAAVLLGFYAARFLVRPL